jgi:2-oxoglutarate/2-oxoacid ferredoxin oxidoreductase subunit alpha
VKVLHYDGTPITARFITNAIRQNVEKAAAASGKRARKELV